MDKLQAFQTKYSGESHLKDLRPGWKVKVFQRIKEGDKTRVQIFQGTVIRRRGRGTNATFAVLKEVRDDVIEKNFLLHSPHIEKIAVATKGKAKRAKLYHLRHKRGAGA